MEGGSSDANALMVSMSRYLGGFRLSLRSSVYRITGRDHVP